MNILIKLLVTAIIAAIVNQTAFAKQLEGEALRTNVIKRLPKLNHTKLQALMQRVGKKAPKGYYQCLCNSYSIMGNGIGYSPNRDKHCDNTDPCKGGNWGCSSYPLPSDSKVIERCIKSAKYNDNSTIIDAIVGAIDDLHGEQNLNRRKIVDNILPLPNEISGDTINLDRLNKLAKEKEAAALEREAKVQAERAEQDWNRSKIIDNISPLPNEISEDTINLARLNKLAKEKEAAALKLKKERDAIDRLNREREAKAQAERDAKLAKELKGKPHKKQLEIIFKEIIQKKLKEKYYVQDPNLVDHAKAFNLTVGRLIDPICNYKGGMCGEFSEFGKEWTQKIIDDNKLFDGKAVVDTLFIEEKSTVNPNSNNIVDRVYDDNHITTRIILPNGKRYILDYWEYMGRSKGKVNILEEKEWIRKWRKDIGITDSLVQRTFIEDELEKLIADKGEDEGIKKFRILNKKNSKKEIYIKSWKDEPWGKEVDTKLEKELLKEERMGRRQEALDLADTIPLKVEEIDPIHGVTDPAIKVQK